MENVLAVIPARGGSKRIPKKNIKTFLGKPIISYSIKAALESELFDEVMVSTDSKEISNISKKFGASVPFLRNNKTAKDNIPIKDVLIEITQKYKKAGKSFDYICCLLPAAPLINIENLKKTFTLLKDKNIDAVIPVVKFSYPIQRALKIENGFLKMIAPKNILINSQDLIPTYHDAGQFYWLKVKSFLKEKQIFMKNTLPFEISELDAEDIDNEADWKISEIKYSLKSLSKK